MPVKIEVYSDYVCPFCLLAKAPLDEMVQEQDVTVEWRPFELRPFPEPTLRPEDPYLPTVWERSVYPMARALGVPISLPTVSPQPYTHLAFEGYQFAKQQGDDLARDYNDRLLRAFFQEDLDIGDVEILTRLASEVGLDSNEFRTALQERRYHEAHQEALRQAREAGVRSVPTFVIGGHAMAGVQSASALRKAIEQAQSSQRERH